MVREDLYIDKRNRDDKKLTCFDAIKETTAREGKIADTVIDTTRAKYR